MNERCTEVYPGYCIQGHSQKKAVKNAICSLPRAHEPLLIVPGKNEPVSSRARRAVVSQIYLLHKLCSFIHSFCTSLFVFIIFIFCNSVQRSMHNCIIVFFLRPYCILHICLLYI